MSGTEFMERSRGGTHFQEREKRDDPGNYRTVSLISVCLKIMEKLSRRR